MHTQNVNTAAQESSSKMGGKKHAFGAKSFALRSLLASALDTANCDVACEQEACQHYGDPFTRTDYFITWISGFISGFRTHLSRKEDHQLHMHNLKMVVKKPQMGKAADVLALLRICLSETCVIEFVDVDIRFNDCRSWQILEGESAVLFNPRSHEKLRDVRRVATTALDVHETKTEELDPRQPLAARAILKLLAEYPTFAALAAHPARIDNA